MKITIVSRKFAIEQRSRHYTSNLVKIGFANESREITNCGNAFLKEETVRDFIEKYYR